jgi:hypothetical protein
MSFFSIKSVHDEAASQKQIIPLQSATEPELRFLRAKVKILNTEIDNQKEEQKKKVHSLHIK